ncbi:MAG: shikimate kinase [Verrucomicrobiales bacterium]|nr:shikimate kinase [Verrucomicrobiales bacterium]
MGTGKSTIGKFSARSLGFRYVDTDDVIVDLAGMSIPEIFQNQGEEAFRDIEIEAVQKVAKSNNQVIATGGGIVTREANRKILKRCGYVIWLKADPESIFERVSRNRNRPLLQTENPLATIRELLAEREELYRETADFEVNTSELTVDEIVHGVTESARIAFC